MSSPNPVTAQNIVDMFKRIQQENNSKDGFSLDTDNSIDFNSENEDEELDKKETEKNKIICRIIKINLKEFYDDIYIPFKFFRDEKWNISKVLNENTDVLFYNEKYITEEDTEKFNRIFNKYVDMIEEIMSDDTPLFIFLKKWTNMSETSWKEMPSKSYLKSIITDQTYQLISPAYTTKIYCELNKKHRSDMDLIKTELEKHLNEIISKLKKEISKFKRNYQEIIESYVFEYPVDESKKTTYSLGFINSIILEILDFSEKLIDLNVYAVHPIILDVIGYYTPLDELNQYDPSEHGGRQYYVV